MRKGKARYRGQKFRDLVEYVPLNDARVIATARNGSRPVLPKELQRDVFGTGVITVSGAARREMEIRRQCFYRNHIANDKHISRRHLYMSKLSCANRL